MGEANCMNYRVLTTGSKTDQLRIVVAIFAVTLFQNLPLNQLPTTYDVYRAFVLGALAALVLYLGGSQPPANDQSSANGGVPV